MQNICFCKIDYTNSESMERDRQRERETEREVLIDRERERKSTRVNQSAIQTQGSLNQIVKEKPKLLKRHSKTKRRTQLTHTLCVKSHVFSTQIVKSDRKV